jgi:pyridoxamine--pyruvate transaminase
MDIHPEDCFADIFITGPGKCLGGAPGLTIMAVSERAWRHIEANPNAPFASVLSLKDWKDAWSKNSPFPFTPSVAEMNGLDAALDHYLEEGPEKVWRRHALTAAATRAGLKAMGLDLWAKTEAIASPTCTALRVPDGLKDSDIIAAARAQYGVVFSSGRGETLGKLIRIGHMGPVAEPIYAVVALTALAGAMRKLGRRIDLGAGIEAANAVIAEDRT